MKSLQKELKQYAHNAGGSYKTVHDRAAMADRLARTLAQMNIQIRHVEHLKTRHIKNYIQLRQQQGISTRTLHNEMSMVRSILKQAGRERLSDSPMLTNQALGLSGVSRAGTKEAIPEDKFQRILSLAGQKDKGLAAALQLSRLLGLRSQEAVQCAQSLKTWANALDKGADKLAVVFGTKGGRPRMTTVIYRDAAAKAVHQALEIAKTQNGRLIDTPNLKQAMSYWRNQTTALGLTGKYSPHSIRYAWAQDAMAHYLQQGFSQKEALALTSMDLGHGDGRGRYVERVYGLNGEE